MYKSLFTMEGDDSEFEGYTDGENRSRYPTVIFTREQAAKWLDSTPYDYRFCEPGTPLNPREYPVLIAYFEDEQTIESTPLSTDDGEILEGYDFSDFEFYEVPYK